MTVGSWLCICKAHVSSVPMPNMPAYQHQALVPIQLAGSTRWRAPRSAVAFYKDPAHQTCRYKTLKKDRRPSYLFLVSLHNKWVFSHAPWFSDFNTTSIILGTTMEFDREPFLPKELPENPIKIKSITAKVTSSKYLYTSAFILQIALILLYTIVTVAVIKRQPDYSPIPKSKARNFTADPANSFVI